MPTEQDVGKTSHRRQRPGESRDLESYGEHLTHQDHLLEQYKIFVDLSDRLSARRLSVNEYFLTLNTLLLATPGAISAFASHGMNIGWILFMSGAGFVICWVWRRIISSYQQLNSAKFAVIHELERFLPYPLFDEEWTKLGRGRDPEKYNSFTSLERKVPYVFLFLHIMLLAWSILAAIGVIPDPS